ncbi:CAP domain-containing protein [Streptomyces megasporus]|uniref:CAP domain-containing protein n=1 Tax=Streptomyces megasporus TaxID=44060 RepID=UPI0004E1C2A0|nr:CAP domain-containing protein [Streptomyces megasporus]
MGRHSRAKPAPAPARVTPARDTTGGRHRSRHRKRSAVPVRTGLLGASAAMAMGAVAVASGLIPGPNGTYTIGGPADSADVRAGGIPHLQTQGATAPPVDREASAADRGDDRGSSPDTTAPSRGSAEPERTPPKKPDEPSPSRSDTPSAGGTEISETPSETPRQTFSRKPTTPSGSSASLGTEAAAEAEVLRLVNLERAAAGCRPLTADPALAELAGEFSRAMADQGFFSHTGPDGDTPWDRAAAAGIDNLGGENIARGQADAAAVMDAWMNSPGHRANILNCDYRTLGVGAHFAEGGPWWTQNFGF